MIIFRKIIVLFLRLGGQLVPRSVKPYKFNYALDADEVSEYEKRKEANKKDIKVEIGPVVRSKIPFSSCLESYMADEVIEDFWSASASVNTFFLNKLSENPSVLIFLYRLIPQVMCVVWVYMIAYKFFKSFFFFCRKKLQHTNAVACRRFLITLLFN